MTNDSDNLALTSRNRLLSFALSCSAYYQTMCALSLRERIGIKKKKEKHISINLTLTSTTGNHPFEVGDANFPNAEMAAYLTDTA